MESGSRDLLDSVIVKSGSDQTNELPNSFMKVGCFGGEPNGLANQNPEYKRSLRRSNICNLVCSYLIS